MKRLVCALLLLSLLLAGCAPEVEKTQFNATYLTLFDTVTTIVGKAVTKEDFQAQAQQIHDELLVYHQLFDIYNEYEGITNLKTINDRAGTGPVTVDQAIIDLLLDCKEYYRITGGRVNVAMGSVLQLWHEARNDGINDPMNAYLPDAEALEAAAEHVSIDAVIVDDENNTVEITDPQVRLDVGAIAKGWSVQRVAETAPKGLLISVGGNVCATGPKEENIPWVVGIQDPDGGDQHLHTLYVSQESVVTSGDYQRGYWVDGKLYHHLIDPDTLFPGRYWRSVSIVCNDSGLADALSTALFLLPLEEGQALLEQCSAEALWVDAQGQLSYSPGFQQLIRT